MENSKYQKFTIQKINRADIKNAEYNPRIMDKEAKKRLKAGLKKHGLVSTLTWNKRTGNLVGGHQRLEQLDALEKNKDYSLDVCVIDVDEAEEATLNVHLNNPSMQGDWDLNKLMFMADDFGIDFVEDMGFTKLDVDTMFDGIFSDAYETPERELVEGRLDEIKAAREKSKEIYKDNAKLNYYAIVLFADEDEKREFFKEISVPFGEQYLTLEQVRRVAD